MASFAQAFRKVFFGAVGVGEMADLIGHIAYKLFIVKGIGVHSLVGDLDALMVVSIVLRHFAVRVLSRDSFVVREVGGRAVSTCFELNIATPHFK
jgi:hypothetical protein